MYIQNQSVTRPYWEPVYRRLTRRIFASRKIKSDVRRLDGLGKGLTIYFLTVVETPKGLRPSGWLWLQRRKDWFAYEVQQLFIFPDFRGCGIATRLFDAAINHQKIMVASGKTHTNTSRSMWESFVRKKKFNIWAHDFDDLNNTSEVFWDEDEIFSQINLYSVLQNGAIIEKNNVRLVATAKGEK